MFLSGTMQVNEHGNLEIGGCDVMELKEKYETPVNILDEKLIRDNCRIYKEAFEKNYEKHQVIYAGKAFLNSWICNVMEEEGLGLDVVSGGELYIALKSNFPPEKIYFHGNNKSPSELEMALDSGVGRIVVDNFYELDLLEKKCQEKAKKVHVYFRVTPGIEAHTHEYIKTGTEDSKFGFNITEDGIWKAVEKVNNLENLNLKGLHCHIGSQIFDKEPFRLTAETMMNVMIKINNEYGILLDELDLGGGIGIRYKGDEKVEGLNNFVKMICDTVKEISETNNFPLPKLMLEPGRSIIGEAGVMLYSVGAIKEIEGTRKYVSVDGGMSDNIRPALYNAEYTAMVANKADEKVKEKVTIAGKACESGDILIKDIDLPEVEPEDTIAMFSCGAYTYSMASNYNLLTRPPVVTVKDGISKIILERETYDDLLAKDLNFREVCKG